MPQQTLHLERKSAGAAAAGLITSNDEGVVEAIVSVTNVVDNVGDLILPGAYAESLAQRTPKGLFNHDDKVWVSRVEHVEELLPGDPRLAAMVAGRKGWPREAGALYVKARFNLGTKAGREAFSTVKFFGREQEWSIGYRVPKGGATRGPDGVRRIKRLDLFEFSPVSFGANSQTFTLSVKSAFADDDLAGRIAECLRHGSPLEVKRDLIRQARETGQLDILPAGWRDGMDAQTALEDLALAAGREVKADRADAGTGVMVAFMLPSDLAQQIAVQDGLPAEDLHITLAYLGKDLDDEALTAAARAAQDVAAEYGPLAGVIGGLGVFPPGDDGVPVFATVDVPGLERLRQRLVDKLEEASVSASAVHGYTPHVTRTYLAEGDPLPEPLPPLEVTLDEISLVRGADRTAFPLSAGESSGASSAGGAEQDRDGWDDLLDDSQPAGETKAAQLDAARAMGLPIPMSLEEIRDKVRQAVIAWVVTRGEKGWVSVEATFPDMAIVSVHGDNDLVSAYQVAYTVNSSGQVEIADPAPVTVTATGTPDVPALVELLDTATAAVKHANLDLETKAGRVLSSATERDLRRALASLLAVFRRAGIDVADPDKPEVRETEELPEEPAIRPDSTAPSALPNEMKTLTAADLADTAEIMAAVYGVAR